MWLPSSPGRLDDTAPEISGLSVVAAGQVRVVRELDGEHAGFECDEIAGSLEVFDIILRIVRLCAVPEQGRVGVAEIFFPIRMN